jgi:hypothetical protein
MTDNKALNNETLNNETLIKELEELRKQKEEADNKLKRYASSSQARAKRYYENHKDIMIDKANERLKKLKETNPEKIKEYSRRAYLKKKERLAKEMALEN